MTIGAAVESDLVNLILRQLGNLAFGQKRTKVTRDIDLVLDRQLGCEKEILRARFDYAPA